MNQISHTKFDINAFNKTRNDISRKRSDYHEILLGNLRETMSKDQLKALSLLKANDLDQTKGASSWLGFLPQEREFLFNLNFKHAGIL